MRAPAAVSATLAVARAALVARACEFRSDEDPPTLLVRVPETSVVYDSLAAIFPDMGKDLIAARAKARVLRECQSNVDGVFLSLRSSNLLPKRPHRVAAVGDVPNSKLHGQQHRRHRHSSRRKRAIRPEQVDSNALAPPEHDKHAQTVSRCASRSGPADLIFDPGSKDLYKSEITPYPYDSHSEPIPSGNLVDFEIISQDPTTVRYTYRDNSGRETRTDQIVDSVYRPIAPTWKLTSGADSECTALHMLDKMPDQRFLPKTSSDIDQFYDWKTVSQLGNDSVDAVQCQNIDSSNQDLIQQSTTSDSLHTHALTSAVKHPQPRSTAPAVSCVHLVRLMSVDVEERHDDILYYYVVAAPQGAPPISRYTSFDRVVSLLGYGSEMFETVVPAVNTALESADVALRNCGLALTNNMQIGSQVLVDTITMHALVLPFQGTIHADQAGPPHQVANYLLNNHFSKQLNTNVDQCLRSRRHLPRPCGNPRPTVFPSLNVPIAQARRDSLIQSVAALTWGEHTKRLGKKRVKDELWTISAPIGSVLSNVLENCDTMLLTFRTNLNDSVNIVNHVRTFLDTVSHKENIRLTHKPLLVILDARKLDSCDIEIVFAIDNRAYQSLAQALRCGDSLNTQRITSDPFDERLCNVVYKQFLVNVNFTLQFL